MTREEFDAIVRHGKQLAATNPDAYLNHIDATNRPPLCEVCDGGGTVVVAVGARDPFGVPDGTVERPCPACPAGDAEAAHRIGRVSDSSSAAQVQQLGARPGESGVSGSLVRGGDPDPSLKDAA